MSMNASDLQQTISQIQAGRDSLAAAIATRTTKIASDKADSDAARAAVQDAAVHRQNDLNALIAQQQAEADAQLAAEQAEVAANAADVTAQQATVDLDNQGLAALDAAIASLQALAANAPPAPVVPPVVTPNVPPTSAPGQVGDLPPVAGGAGPTFRAKK